MKPPRPRITKPRLVWRWQGAWKPYHRVTWTEGNKRRQKSVLLDWRGDPQRLDDEYWKCEAGRHKKQRKTNIYTWGRLVKLWQADPIVQRSLAASTKRSYARDITFFLEKNADKDVRDTTRKGVRAIHQALADTPRKADKLIGTMRMLWNYANDQQDWDLGPNPAQKITMYGKQREFMPWPDWMVGKLEDAPEPVRTTAELILGTGQRPGAAVIMRHDAFRGDVVQVTDQKGAEVFEIYCPTRLRSYIASLPVRGAHVLPKNLTEPMGYYVVERRFRVWRDTLGEKAKPYSLHGLRKLAIIQMAEAGCSDAEIQAVTNQSTETVAYYRRLASRKILSKNAANRADGA